MKNRRKKLTPGSVISWILGLLCAAVLGAVFYGAMAYQLSGGETEKPPAAEVTPAALAPGMSSAELFPGPLLALADAQLAAERARDLPFGGQSCRVIERTYALPSGGQAAVISAYPAAYLERMALEGYVPQLITGFSLAGMNAVYARKESKALLCAGDGSFVYMLETEADEQTVYALGMAAYLE